MHLVFSEVLDNAKNHARQPRHRFLLEGHNASISGVSGLSCLCELHTDVHG